MQVGGEDYIRKRRAAKLFPARIHGPVPVIERGVPMPTEARGGSRHHEHYYPFERMAIGDSFWVSGNSECTRGAVSKFERRTGWKFIIRAQRRDGRANHSGARDNGHRVWRRA